MRAPQKWLVLLLMEKSFAGEIETIYIAAGV